VLTLLVSAAAIMHSGQAFAALFVCLAIPLLLATAIFERCLPSLEDLALIALPPAVAMIATGVMARPTNETWFPDFKLPWETIVYLVLDLNYFLPAVAAKWTSPMVLLAMLMVCVAGWIILSLIAIAARSPLAIALLCGPALLAVALYPLNMATTAVQIAGFPYPAMLCAAVVLAQQYRKSETPVTRAQYLLVGGTIAVLVAIHIPRLLGSVLRYTRDADPRQVVSVSDFDRLQAAIGDRELYVDIRVNPRSIEPVMAELGRRKVKLVWSPKSWYYAASFRGWAAPSVDKTPDLRLIGASEPLNGGERIIVETPPYRLVDTAGGTAKERE
jgi:hypothetical protein